MNNRKIFAGLIVLMIVGATLSACAPTPAPSAVKPTSVPATAATAAFPLTLTDDANRSVTLKAAPQRIVSLAPSNTETIYALGKGAFVVGVTEYCDYPAEAKAEPKIGGFTQIDLEKVIGLAPDLVLATDIHAKSIVPELQNRGLIVFVIEPKNVDEVISKLSVFGKLLGAPDEVNRLSAQLKSRMDSVTSKVAAAKTKPRVFYEIDKTLFTPGPGSFVDDLLTKAGAANIASDAKGGYGQLSTEIIIARDPEVILLGDMLFGETPETLKARPGWGNITAVKTNRIIPVPDENLVARPGPRIIDGLEMVARALYPDLFK